MNHTFPCTTIGNKTRSFNAMWYKQYYPCRLLSHASNKAKDCFVTLGFRDWKHADGKGGAFAKHNTSKSHQEALMNWNQFKVTIATGSSVGTRLDSARKEQIKKNRHYLIAVIQSLMYCATQEIALHGHWETPTASNQGNFLELVKLLAMYDPIINDRLTSGPQNALYTSHTIQNQLLHILGEKLRNGICHQVQSAGVFSILADETKDFSKQEQMCFVVRYVDMAQGEIHEHFLTYVEAKSLDAASLSTYIRNLLLKFDLDSSKIVSQGYDGASLMSGRCVGVQAKVREFAPIAVYIHCYAHVLNLVLVDSCKSVSSASEFFALLEALYVFMASLKAHVVFIEVQKKTNPNKQPLKLQKLSDTRWACRHAAINTICYTYDSLLMALEEIGLSSDHSKAVEAKGLLFQVQSFSFLLSLVIFDRILSCTKQLSDQLQSSKIDLYRASELVTASKAMLQQFRTDEYWNQIFSYTTDIANTHSISTEVSESRSTRKRRRPANLDDSIATDSVGSREPMTTSSQYKTRLYFPVLDKFLVEMNARFNHSNSITLKGIATCSPSSSAFLEIQDMKEFALMYGIDVTTLEMEIALVSRVTTLSSITTTVDFGRYLHSCLPAYQNFYDVVQIALTIAVSSAECERSFSSLKRIKTRLLWERIVCLTWLYYPSNGIWLPTPWTTNK